MGVGRELAGHAQRRGVRSHGACRAGLRRIRVGRESGRRSGADGCVEGRVVVGFEIAGLPAKAESVVMASYCRDSRCCCGVESAQVQIAVFRKLVSDQV